jgi:hypothetical protein
MARKRGPSFGGRKRFNLLKIGRFRLYQNTSLRLDADGLHGGLRSRAWTLGTPLGPLTHNLATDRWTWDTPGWGAVHWTGRFRDVFSGAPLLLKIVIGFWLTVASVLALIAVSLAAAVIIVLIQAWGAA